MKAIKINLSPIGKPRMTRSDAWKKRECVLRYWDFKDKLNKQAGDFVLADSYSVLFCVPFPKSYPKKKMKSLFLKPHQEKPDLDNMVKAINDSFHKEDKHIYKTKSKKIWAYKPSIILINHF